MIKYTFGGKNCECKNIKKNENITLIVLHLKLEICTLGKGGCDVLMRLGLTCMSTLLTKMLWDVHMLPCDVRYV